MELGHLDEAIDHFKQALGIDQERHDGAGLARSHRRLGTAFREDNDFARAEESFREAAQALEGQEDEREQALLQVSWGALSQDLGHYTKAGDAYRRARTGRSMRFAAALAPP